MKNWRALGPWFQRRFRTLSTSSGVHRKLGFVRVSARDFGSDSRTSLVMVASSEAGGGSIPVVRD